MPISRRELASIFSRRGAANRQASKQLYHQWAHMENPDQSGVLDETLLGAIAGGITGFMQGGPAGAFAGAASGGLKGATSDGKQSGLESVVGGGMAGLAAPSKPGFDLDTAAGIYSAAKDPGGTLVSRYNAKKAKEEKLEERKYKEGREEDKQSHEMDMEKEKRKLKLQDDEKKRELDNQEWDRRYGIKQKNKKKTDDDIDTTDSVLSSANVALNNAFQAIESDLLKNYPDKSTALSMVDRVASSMIADIDTENFTLSEEEAEAFQKADKEYIKRQLKSEINVKIRDLKKKVRQANFKKRKKEVREETMGIYGGLKKKRDRVLSNYGK